MKQTFYSNGKLLITGEYVVLDGAVALAVPTKFGQYLSVEKADNENITWLSRDINGTIWLEAKIPFTAIIANKQDNDVQEINTLTNILHEAHKVNPELLNNSSGFKVITELTFPREWGLGTSSTLINNIAQWFKIDAFKLLKHSFGGSGYDIACAQNNTPLLYQLKGDSIVVKPVLFSPKFADNLYFVYLNKKQNSRSAITSYKQRKNDLATIINELNAITTAVIEANDIYAFKAAMEKHEDVMSGALGQANVKETLFPDFRGAMKSLGAWGGDFILAATDENPVPYFKEKGFEIIIPYNGMILK